MNHYIIAYFHHRESEMEFMGWYGETPESALQDFDNAYPEMWSSMVYAPVKTQK